MPWHTHAKPYRSVQYDADTPHYTALLDSTLPLPHVTPRCGTAPYLCPTSHRVAARHFTFASRYSASRDHNLTTHYYTLCYGTITLQNLPDHTKPLHHVAIRNRHFTLYSSNDEYCYAESSPLSCRKSKYVFPIV